MSEFSWSDDFAKAHEHCSEPFASLAVNGEVVVGDGATFGCHASAVFEAGTLDVCSVNLRPNGDYTGTECLPREPWYLALLRGHRPVRWECAGHIVCDSASGAILDASTRDEICNPAVGEFFMWEQVDDADLPAVVHSPSGAEVAVFSLRDDGTYPVIAGLDAVGKACALMIYV